MSTHALTRPTTALGDHASLETTNASLDRLDVVITTALPGEPFKLEEDGDDLTAIFENELTAEQITTLTTAVDGFTPEDITMPEE